MNTHRIEKVMLSSITRPGTITNDIGITIFNQDNVDVTSCYDITYELGQLTVHPIQLIIKSEGSSKVYDGEPLENPTWELVHGTLLENHTLIVEMDTSLVNI